MNWGRKQAKGKMCHVEGRIIVAFANKYPVRERVLFCSVNNTVVQ
jgi:hypothetical protein